MDTQHHFFASEEVSFLAVKPPTTIHLFVLKALYFVQQINMEIHKGHILLSQEGMEAWGSAHLQYEGGGVPLIIASHNMAGCTLWLPAAHFGTT